jgi:hypothetical protein
MGHGHQEDMMAITVKSMSGIKALKTLGVEAELVDWLEQSGLQVMLKPKEITLTVPEESGIQPPMIVQALTVEQVVKLANGTLTGPAKAILASTMKTVLVSAKGIYGEKLEQFKAANPASSRASRRRTPRARPRRSQAAPAGCGEPRTPQYPAQGTRAARASLA